MREIDEQLESIEERNRRVELDKAWETSWTRRLCIASITYGLAGAWLLTIGAKTPWLNALVPTGGYLLSTLTLPFLKSWWLAGKK
jgi:hypothetical protein